MTAALREPQMAKRKASKEGEAPGKTTVKLAEDVARKARIVAAIRGVDLFDYLDSIVRPIIDRDHERAVREEAKE
jgi:hypothetical protein